ncbi:WhiB family transcriptional regulator [Nakamurella sp.]|uniref:WhiB family transcriptional regulator n=1 Tax=Nakamurella sp. TaxID=1869182 RepID=UPI003784AA82
MATYDLPAVPGHLIDPAADARAACRGHDPELWFPAPTQDRSVAVGLCRGCPIRESCEQWAMASLASGIWGGVLFDRGRPDGANTKWRNPYRQLRTGRAS